MLATRCGSGEILRYAQDDRRDRSQNGPIAERTNDRRADDKARISRMTEARIRLRNLNEAAGGEEKTDRLNVCPT
jgi:hypothetical protein